MTRITVLFGTVLLAVAMSAAAGGIKDVVDPALTGEVEGMLERSLRDYAGLAPTQIPPAPVPVDRIPAGMPIGRPAHVGAAFVEIPLIVEDGHRPLTDLDVLYGVSGPPPVVPAQVMVDDAALVAWGSPPLDAK